MQNCLAKVIGIKKLNDKVVELETALVIPEKMEFKPGQFMQFHIGDQLRPYSIISKPHNCHRLDFLIELLEQGVGSEYIGSLKIGDEIAMSGPYGIFTASQFERDYCFVATGVGIAPFIPMIGDMLQKGCAKNITLLQGVRSEEDLIYSAHFNSLARQYPNFKYRPMLSRPKAFWPGETGRVTTCLDTHYQDYKTCVFYLCGCREMVKEARDLLVAKGHNPLEIKLEIFV